MGQISPQPETLSLELPSAITLHVTQEQFEALSAANRDLRLERTAAGELIVNPPTGGESGRRNLSISTQLGNWVEAHEGLGEAFDSSTGFRLPNGADRSPDASWLSQERWESLTPNSAKTLSLFAQILWSNCVLNWIASPNCKPRCENTSPMERDSDG